MSANAESFLEQLKQADSPASRIQLLKQWASSKPGAVERELRTIEDAVALLDEWAQHARRIEDRVETLEVLLREERKVSANLCEVIAAVLKLKADNGG